MSGLIQGGKNNFKTSYITVNLNRSRERKNNNKDFKTSYVTVNQLA